MVDLSTNGKVSLLTAGHSQMTFYYFNCCEQSNLPLSMDWIEISIYAFIICLILQHVLYKLLPLPKHWISADPTYQAEWANRIVAVSHASFVVWLQLENVYLHIDQDWNYIGQYGSASPLNSRQTLSFGIAVGYFVADSIYCQLYTNADKLMHLHHVLAVVPLLYALLTESHANEVGLAFLILEMTNPLLHLRFFLLAAGKKGSFILFLEELTFFSLFIFLRIVAGSWMAYGVITSETVNDTMKYCCISFHLLDVVWGLMMCQSVMKLYKKYQSKSYKWQVGYTEPSDKTE